MFLKNDFLMEFVLFVFGAFNDKNVVFGHALGIRHHEVSDNFGKLRSGRAPVKTGPAAGLHSAGAEPGQLRRRRRADRVRLEPRHCRPGRSQDQEDS